VDGLLQFGGEGWLLNCMGLLELNVFFQQDILKVDLVIVNGLGLTFFKQVSDSLFGRLKFVSHSAQ
jgi:hypothetical protein